MATTLKSPYGGAVIEVADELADRYQAAGWLVVRPAPRAKRAKRVAKTATDTTGDDPGDDAP